MFSSDLFNIYDVLCTEEMFHSSRVGFSGRVLYMRYRMKRVGCDLCVLLCVFRQRKKNKNKQKKRTNKQTNNPWSFSQRTAELFLRVREDVVECRDVQYNLADALGRLYSILPAVLAHVAFEFHVGCYREAVALTFHSDIIQFLLGFHVASLTNKTETSFVLYLPAYGTYETFFLPHQLFSEVDPRAAKAS